MKCIHGAHLFSFVPAKFVLFFIDYTDIVSSSWWLSRLSIRCTIEIMVAKHHSIWNNKKIV